MAPEPSRRPPVPQPPPPPSMATALHIHKTALPWSRAVTAAVSVGVPILVGAIVDNRLAGITASLGGFVGQYFHEVPYRRRAALLAWAGLGFVAAAIVASATAGNMALAAVGLGLVGFIATFLCLALGVAPPGAFLYVLVAVIAVELPDDALADRAVLVAAGVAWAWVVSMSRWVGNRRGPEVRALRAAYQSLADFFEANETLLLDRARRDAGTALVHSRVTLTTAASSRRRDPTLARLVLLARQANALFLAGVAMVQEGGGPLRPGSVAAVRGLAASIDDPARAAALVAPEPLVVTAARVRIRDELAAAIATAAAVGAEPRTVARAPSRNRLWPLVRAATRRDGVAVPTAARVGIVVAGAMLVGAVATVERPSWVALTAAAVLGGNVVVTMQRAVQRVAGTVGGVLVGAGLLVLEPSIAGVAVIVMVLQLGLHLFSGYSYALATLFMTPLALVLSGSTGVDVSDLAVTRIVDTLLGVAVGLVGSAAVWPRFSSARVPAAIGRAIAAEGALLDLVTSGAAADDVEAWRQARARVRAGLMDLHSIYDVAIGERLPPGSMLERSWPVVIAVDRLGYLTESLRRLDDDVRLSPDDRAAFAAVFRDLAESARRWVSPGPLPVPSARAQPAITVELRTLQHALRDGVAPPVGRSGR